MCVGPDSLLSPGDDEAGRGDAHLANPEDWADVDPSASWETRPVSGTAQNGMVRRRATDRE
jgi:hypothetical protein